MQKSLQGKNAIVTGGSRGIGAGVAKELAKRGANVLLTYNTSATSAEGIVNEIKALDVDCFAMQAKANNRDAPKAIAKAAADRWGCIDIVVNNAAAREDFSFSEMTYDMWERQLGGNLMFPVFLVREATQYFGVSPRIVNFSSSYAQDGHTGCMAYSASKGAIESVTRSLARELGQKHNATVNCVRPGPVNTELWGRSIEDEEVSRSWEKIIQSTPAGARVAEVDDVGQVVAFLCEEGSRWITGSVINISGGLMFS